jgi:hypothetical protein
VPDEHRAVADEVASDLVERHPVGARAVDGQVESREVLEELGGIREVGLRDAEERLDAGVVRCDEIAVDEPDARLGVRRRDDDHHLVGVRDDDALDLVGVVGAAPEQCRALADAHDAGERAGLPARVADEVDVIAGHD